MAKDKELSDKKLKHELYIAAVIEGVAMRLLEFGECEVDNGNLTKIWEKPWISKEGSFKQRVRVWILKALDELYGIEAEVSWPQKGTTCFTKKRERLIVLPGNTTIH